MPDKPAPLILKGKVNRFPIIGRSGEPRRVEFNREVMQRLKNENRIILNILKNEKLNSPNLFKKIHNNLLFLLISLELEKHFP